MLGEYFIVFNVYQWVMSAIDSYKYINASMHMHMAFA
jgi:hypothetical protein